MMLKATNSYIFSRFKTDSDWGLLFREEDGSLVWDSNVYLAEIYSLEEITWEMLASINQSIKDGYTVEYVENIENVRYEKIVIYPGHVFVPFSYMFKKFLQSKGKI